VLEIRKKFSHYNELKERMFFKHRPSLPKLTRVVLLFVVTMFDKEAEMVIPEGHKLCQAEAHTYAYTEMTV
jgi:hypothetical protein